ncbi:transglycosylase domain-containing protein [Microbacterium aurantiacum]|uniref:transglycosylase domain-containing protein n=1 Tax=Microbacterium aurantiacum TaxID=162393 RepID=UPI0040379DD8
MPDTKRTATGVLGGLAGLVGLSAVAGVLITATVTPAIAVSGYAASSAITMFDNLPSVLEIDKLMLPTTLYTKNQDSGEWEEWTQFYDQNRSPVEFDEIAPVMYDAMLSSEDPRYYQHGGVDLIGTTRAVLSNVQGGGETQGGSTISQQYVKNILVQRCEATAETEEEKQACWFEATTAAGTEGIQRKLQEMRYAIALEQRYSKNEIMLGYLNIANFGGTTYGIDAAAKRYFGVSAGELNLAQAATLAGIVQNPNTYRIDQPGNERNGADNGYALTKQRQQYVLSRLLDDGKITQEQYDELFDAPIEPNITTPRTGCTAAAGGEYFCQYVRSVIENDPAFGETPDERREALRRGGLNVYTTIDWRLQNAANASMSTYAPTSVEGMKFGSTAVSIDNTTGKILAMSQNTRFDETITGDNNFSSIVFAGDRTYGGSRGFAAGSTFKLFTLVDWLEQGRSVREVLNGVNRPFPRMTNSCTGDWVNTENTTIGNFGRVPGYIGTPLQFTAASLNSGYLAMAAELDLCEIDNVATKIGVTTGDGTAITMDVANNVIGDSNISPIAMAGAYGTVANNGVYCQPRVIESVTDSDGNDVPLPERTCEQVLEPGVAATAAFALEGVMNGGGTGAQGNPFDGTPLIGKTGTHEELQTWLVESSTNVSTAVWAGNIEGGGDMFRNWHNGIQLSNLRYFIARDVQGAANSLFGGNPFPAPDNNLTRQVLRDLPNVVGQSIDQATATLRNAGFSVTVGGAVDSSEPEGIVAAQSPGAGRVAGGTSVTINPSNGQGISVPAVSGSLSAAISALRNAGFGNVSPGSCQQDENAGGGEQATGTNPAAGTLVNRNTAISVDYVSRNCGGGGGESPAPDSDSDG